MKTLFVSIEGNDAWSGTSPVPTGHDGPFRTLPHALEAAREAGGADVMVGGGDYEITESLVFDERDSGATWKAWPGETVRLIGGKVLSQFAEVTDAEILSRLREEARAHVVCCDLRASGITDFGGLSSSGKPGADGRHKATHMELYVGDRAMTIAQYPNAGEWSLISGHPVPIKDEWNADCAKLDGGFFYDDERPSGWKWNDDIWVHGYWSWDWLATYEHVSLLDIDKKLVKTHEPYGYAYFRKGQRFYFFNVLEELDQPGEYYIDREAGVLYFWPDADLATTEALVTVLDGPIVRLREVADFTLEGFEIVGSRDDGVYLESCRNITIRRCKIRNIGNYGIWVDKNSTTCAIVSCEIYNTGFGGISLNGGDRKTLTPAHHRADNNHIHHVAHWYRCYQTAINITGVGMSARHNLLHDMPHTAILY